MVTLLYSCKTMLQVTKEKQSLCWKMRNLYNGWLPQSPDLNPIEMVWQWMQFKVDKISFKNIAELQEFVFELWQNLPNDIIDSFISKILEKMEWIEAHNGVIFEDK